jgi:hypothetical protein
LEFHGLNTALVSDNGEEKEGKIEVETEDETDIFRIIVEEHLCGLRKLNSGNGNKRREVEHRHNLISIPGADRALKY